MRAGPDMVGVEAAFDVNEPAWRQARRSPGLDAARSREERRAAVPRASVRADRRKRHHRVHDPRGRRAVEAFAAGLLRIFRRQGRARARPVRGVHREAGEDIQHAVEAQIDPVERLHVYTIRLHEWCDPGETPQNRGTHNRRRDLRVLDPTGREEAAPVRGRPRTPLPPALRPARRSRRRRCDPASPIPDPPRGLVPPDRDELLVHQPPRRTRANDSPPKQSGSSAAAGSTTSS